MATHYYNPEDDRKIAGLNEESIGGFEQQVDHHIQANTFDAPAQDRTLNNLDEVDETQIEMDGDEFDQRIA